VHNWELVVGWLGAACLIYVLLHDRRRDGSAAPAASAVGGLTAGVSGA
jgi:hypothetical protein